MNSHTGFWILWFFWSFCFYDKSCFPCWIATTSSRAIQYLQQSKHHTHYTWAVKYCDRQRQRSGRADFSTPLLDIYLFSTTMSHIPLAERVRPQTLDEIIGQDHLTGKNWLLTKLLQNQSIHSLIFWWPPGTGKTTLARIVASSLEKTFFQLSAVTSGVKDLRQIIERSEKLGDQTVLFIDEIHRFNKSQQDALLHGVESWSIVLIGATTENPWFEVNNALLSRSQVLVVNPLSEQEILQTLERAIRVDDLLKTKDITLQEPNWLIGFASWDARKALNLLELIVKSSPSNTISITNKLTQEVAQTNLNYDKSWDNHYDTISAFIKSIRGSDPHAALYRLARMLESWEDPKFIARRLIISASEDIGNANPNALLLATSTFDAITTIGMPEWRIILGQCVSYLASSPKSNASYTAINQAQELVRKTWNLPVPLHLRNAPTDFAASHGYGQDYHYTHDYPWGFVSQEYFPDKLSGTTLYQPKDNPTEQKLQHYLDEKWWDKYISKI